MGWVSGAGAGTTAGGGGGSGDVGGGVGRGGGKSLCGGADPSRDAGLRRSGISCGLLRGGTSRGGGGVAEGV